MADSAERETLINAIAAGDCALGCTTSYLAQVFPIIPALGQNHVFENLAMPGFPTLVLFSGPVASPAPAAVTPTIFLKSLFKIATTQVLLLSSLT